MKDIDMKKIFLLPSFFILFLFSAQAFSQTSQIAYPIVELGNCGSLSECKEYCDEAVHKDACITYAKSKGFYNQEALEQQKDQILTKAKTLLGCATKEECQTFCSLDENAEACSRFAKANNLPGGKNESNSSVSVLQKAQSELGCTTKESCKELCAMEENREKCSAFAKTNKLIGGIKKVGPGGCTSEADCVEYCKSESNSRECSAFGLTVRKDIKGPGGCSTAESCREYCAQNPEECEDFDAKRPKEEIVVEKKEEKVFDKTEQKEKVVQQKSPIIKIIQLFTNTEKEQEEEDNKPTPIVEKKESDEYREPTTIPKVLPKEETRPIPKPTEKLFNNNLDLNVKVEACIKEGCIWKETYCNCEFKNSESKPTKTPYPTKPVLKQSGSKTIIKPVKPSSTKIPKPSSTEIEYEYNSSSSVPGETDTPSAIMPDHEPTPQEPMSGVQGASTEKGLVNFLKGLFY